MSTNFSNPIFPTIYQLLTTQTGRSAEAVAIVAPECPPLTYGRLQRHVQATISQLNELGLGRNDRVAIVLPNGPEMAVAFLAMAAGATSAPLNPAYRAAEFDFYLSDLNARALVILAGLASPAREVAEARGIPIIELTPLTGEAAGLFSLAGPLQPLTGLTGPAQPDDIALVLHTSGTTSRPKIVPLTQRNLCTSAANIGQTLQLTPADCCLNVMPLFHIHGLIAAVLASLAAGARVVCPPGFHTPHFFDWLAVYRPTWYTAVPTMHQAILARAAATQPLLAQSRLRLIRSSSASLPPQVMAELERFFNVPVIEAYGMTEAAHQMASNPLPPHPRKPGSVGRAAGPEVAIMAEKGEALLPAGIAGEVVIRGANVTLGYANNPAANAQAFTQGWFRTGDQGYLDEEGYLYLTGRLKELINRGGEKISPREIDEVLLGHPAIAQALAFAIPDEQLGEDVAAAVVLREGASVTGTDIRHFAAARLADFKVPRQVVILPEIPKGPTGKLQRLGLAEKLGLTRPAPTEAEAPVPFVAPQSDIEEILAEIWAEVLGLEQVGARHKFLDLGGDSILATQLVARVRQTLQLELSLIDFFEAPTVAEQAQLVEKLLLQELQTLTDEEAQFLLQAGEAGV